MTPPARFPRAAAWGHRWGMLMVVLILLAWLWGLFFWFGSQQKRQLLVDRGGELALMASAVAQQSWGILHSVEGNLQALDVWLVTHPGADPLSDPRFVALVDQMRGASGGLLDIRMVSDAGMLYYLPALDGKPRADVKDREYFGFHAAGAGSLPRAVHINAPVRSRVTQRWDVPVSMQLTPQAGTAGVPAHGGQVVIKVIFAAVGLEQLAGRHENMRFKPDGSISLVRADGVLLSRAPMAAPYIGRNISGSRHFASEYGQSAKGSFVSEGSMTDGVLRLVSYERLERFAVTVLVSRGLNDIYETHDKRLRTTLLLSAVLSAVVLSVTAFLHRSQRSQHAMRIMQAHLQRLATTDELTGVMNRRAFMEAAHREFERAQRYARPAAVLALDIDHFKRVNDEYGHAGGDLALRVCASRWQSALREQDLLGRIGGEEFCILLPETTEAQAALIAERLRLLTVGAPILGEHRGVSVSIGWSAIGPTDSNWALVLERADHALYEAKTSGRNCVCPAPSAVVCATAEHTGAG